eukprot:5977531-Amphidinium_carterae.1
MTHGTTWMSFWTQACTKVDYNHFGGWRARLAVVVDLWFCSHLVRDRYHCSSNDNNNKKDES